MNEQVQFSKDVEDGKLYEDNISDSDSVLTFFFFQ